MPTYTYRCHCGNEFDRRTSYDAVETPCTCGAKAVRVPFYRQQGIKTEDAPIPASEPEERRRKGIRDLFAQGWDYSRALEHLHNHIVETPLGKGLDLRE